MKLKERAFIMLSRQYIIAMTKLISLLLVCGSVLGACASDQHAPRTRLPGVDKEEEHGQDKKQREDVFRTHKTQVAEGQTKTYDFNAVKHVF